MSEAEDNLERQARMTKAKKGITYLLFFSIVMFFAGLNAGSNSVSTNRLILLIIRRSFSFPLPTLGLTPLSRLHGQAI